MVPCEQVCFDIQVYISYSNYSITYSHISDVCFKTSLNVVWWQNGDLGHGWVLECIQCFIIDSGRWHFTDHKSY